MKALFLGDSHIAEMSGLHVAWLERELSAIIEVAARGGAWSGDLRAQIEGRDLSGFDVVLLSIGTNDAHPASGSSFATLHQNLSDILVECSRAALLISPGVQYAPPPFDTDRLNRSIRACVDSAADLVSAAGGELVPTGWVLDRLGQEAWAPDGLHLSTKSYDLLLPALANALRGEGAQRGVFGG